MAKFVILTVLWLLVSTCQPPSSPSAGTRFVPPLDWVADWDAMQRCTNIRGDFVRVAWYRVVDGGIGAQVMGRWDFPHHITLTEFVLSRNVAATRRHEMVHDLTQSGAHGPAFARCGVS